jgi:hypothetical protein
MIVYREVAVPNVGIIDGGNYTHIDQFCFFLLFHIL